MKKFIFAAVAVLLILTYAATHRNNDFTPYEEVLARRINDAQLCVCQDEQFNTEIKVPSIFTMEEDTSDIAYSYVRFAYYPPTRYIDAEGQIIIEYCASVCKDKHNWTSRIDSTTQDDGYRVYSKSVHHQKMKFTYRLTYPATYETCMSKLKKEVRKWKAFSPNRPEIQLEKGSHHKLAKRYHSGFAT